MRGVNTLVYLLGIGMGLSVQAASSNAHAYQSIVERNVFGLNPPKPGGPPAPPVEPPPKLTLTGITTLLGNKRALLSMQIPNKPTENFILTEGQRDRGIEVLQIDENARTVKVLNHGNEQILNFVTDGAKPQPALLPTGVVPGQPPVPSSAAYAPPTLRTIPGRSLRLPQFPSPPQSGESAPMNSRVAAP